jgi:hypothetical protein
VLSDMTSNRAMSALLLLAVVTLLVGRFLLCVLAANAGNTPARHTCGPVSPRPSSGLWERSSA